MLRWLSISLVVVGLTACTDDEQSESFTSFGSASSGEGSTTASSSTSGGTSASTSGESTTTDSGTTDSTTSTSTSASTSTSTTTTSASTGGSTTGMPDNVDLGECVGLGAWTSCDMYCAAILEVCVESGCDGSTVVYYDDVNVCTAMTNGSGSAQSCSDGFDMSGQNSFARCCCGQP